MNIRWNLLLEYVASPRPTVDCYDNESTSNKTFFREFFRKEDLQIRIIFISHRLLNFIQIMHSARRTITSGNRVREVDLYSGFNKTVVNLQEEDEDEAYQNALKVSSYGKRNTTPKTNWVSSMRFEAMKTVWEHLNSDQWTIANRRSSVNCNGPSQTVDRNSPSGILIGNIDVRPFQSSE